MPGPKIRNSKSKRKDVKNNHMRRNSDERFSCDFKGCNYEAKTTHNLRLHKKTRHTDVRKWKCKVFGCSGAFKIKQHLTRHLKEVHPYSPPTFGPSGSVPRLLKKTSVHRVTINQPEHDSIYLLPPSISYTHEYLEGLSEELQKKLDKEELLVQETKNDRKNSDKKTCSFEELLELEKMESNLQQSLKLLEQPTSSNVSFSLDASKNYTDKESSCLQDDETESQDNSKLRCDEILLPHTTHTNTSNSQEICQLENEDNSETADHDNDADSESELESDGEKETENSTSENETTSSEEPEHDANEFSSRKRDCEDDDDLVEKTKDKDSGAETTLSGSENLENSFHNPDMICDEDKDIFEDSEEEEQEFVGLDLENQDFINYQNESQAGNLSLDSIQTNSLPISLVCGNGSSGNLNSSLKEVLHHSIPSDQLFQNLTSSDSDVLTGPGPTSSNSNEGSKKTSPRAYLPSQHLSRNSLYSKKNLGSEKKNICGEQGSLQRASPQRHLSRPKIHGCKDCAKTFATLTGLEEHAHIHSSVKSIHCEGGEAAKLSGLIKSSGLKFTKFSVCEAMSHYKRFKIRSHLISKIVEDYCIKKEDIPKVKQLVGTTKSGKSVYKKFIEMVKIEFQTEIGKKHVPNPSKKGIKNNKGKRRQPSVLKRENLRSMSDKTK